MKMKIPIVDPSNIFSSQESSSDNSEAGQHEEVESNPLVGADTPAAPDDFEEYLWMENEEEFDKQILQQLEEEALMEDCLEAMLEQEEYRKQECDRENMLYVLYDQQTSRRNPQAQNGFDLCRQMSSLRVQDKDELAKQSTLNPNAAEFVPQSRISGIALVEKSS